MARDGPERKLKQFDALKFNWLGAIDAYVTPMVLAWHTTPFQTFEDTLKTPMRVGANGATSFTAGYPYALNGILGAKQNGSNVESHCLRELNRILLEMGFAFREQKDQHGIANIDLVPVLYVLLHYRYAIDQRAVATAQIADGKLVSLSRNQAVPA